MARICAVYYVAMPFGQSKSYKSLDFPSTCAFPLLPCRRAAKWLEEGCSWKSRPFQGSIDTSCSFQMYRPVEMIRILVLKWFIWDHRASLLFEEIAHLLHAACVDLFQITDTTRLSRLVFLLFLFYATLLLCTGLHLLVIQTTLAAKVGHCP